MDLFTDGELKVLANVENKTTAHILIKELATELIACRKEIAWHNKHWEILQRDYDISQAQLLDEEDFELEEWPDGKPIKP
jgi:hypothetical protein